MADTNRLQPGPSTRLRRSENLLTTEMDGETIMMDPEKGLYFGLDPIGTDIWRRLAAPVLVADLIAALARDYQTPAADVERDVLILLSHMAEHGMVSAC